jgi:AcrR family transcriptional regulator
MARELLGTVGLEGLTYSVLAEGARVTRQTLYRHWPTRAALLRDLILEMHDVQPLEASSSDPAVIARMWLDAIRRGLADHSTRVAVAAVIAQADSDADSAQALQRIAEDRLDALNRLLEPCGLRLTADQYTQLCGPLLMRIFVDHAEASDGFLDSVAAQWCAALPGSFGQAAR